MPAVPHLTFEQQITLRQQQSTFNTHTNTNSKKIYRRSFIIESQINNTKTGNSDENIKHQNEFLQNQNLYHHNFETPVPTPNINQTINKRSAFNSVRGNTTSGSLKTSSISGVNGGPMTLNSPKTRNNSTLAYNIFNTNAKVTKQF